MKPGDDRKVEPTVVAELYAKYSGELHAFLLGVLRDGHRASDALQATFAKAAELGQSVRPESAKAWLFRVALNEALAMRRREGVAGRAMRDLAWAQPQAVDSPDEQASRREMVDAVRAAIDELPAEQRQVVKKRIYEQKTFAAIARELNVPLGTVLTRMQLALGKLRGKLEPNQ